jgi:hypothetical protein
VAVPCEYLEAAELGQLGEPVVARRHDEGAATAGVYVSGVLQQCRLGGVSAGRHRPRRDAQLGQHGYQYVGGRLDRRVASDHVVHVTGACPQRTYPRSDQCWPRPDRADRVLYIDQQHPGVCS